MSDFKKLLVWQKAHALALTVDRVSRKIRDPRYASLRSQIFRAASSIPANIAEGRRQESEKEFARFLRYALNSASQLEYHTILGRDTKAIPAEDCISMLDQTITVRKMLYALLKRLSSDASKRNPHLTQSRSQPTASPQPTADTLTAPGR